MTLLLRLLLDSCDARHFRFEFSKRRQVVVAFEQGRHAVRQAAAGVGEEFPYVAANGLTVSINQQVVAFPVVPGHVHIGNAPRVHLVDEAVRGQQVVVECRSRLPVRRR